LLLPADWLASKKKRKERDNDTDPAEPPPRLVGCDTLCSDRFPSLCRKKRKVKKGKLQKKEKKKTKEREIGSAATPAKTVSATVRPCVPVCTPPFYFFPSPFCSFIPFFSSHL
jgi:hypothetical protein